MKKKKFNLYFPNFILLLVSIIVSIILIEFILFFFGPYKYLTTTNLKPSISVYERPANSYQRQKHPDLNYISTHYYDLDGVKNHNPKSLLSSKRENIIGFFGDSMIENIFIHPKFNFVNLLNSKIVSNNYIINFGIGGYSLDQIFLRYLKYSNLNFDYVFCYINPGDHVTRNILSFDIKGNYNIIQPEFSLFQKIIGKLNISYFLIDIFYRVRAEFFENHIEIDKKNYNQILSSRFYRNKYNTSEKTEKDFINIIKNFQREVEKRNAKFLILLYPDAGLVNYFKQQISETNLKLEYYVLDRELLENKNFRFKNDGHWNELGNLKLAQNLIGILEKYSIKFEDKNFDYIKNKINYFYITYK